MHRIGLIADYNVTYERKVIEAILSSLNRPRDLVFRQWPPDPAVFPKIIEWQPHGIITNLTADPKWRTLSHSQIPVIGMGNPVSHCHVGIDDQSVGRLAADYLASSGFAHFGFVHFSTFPFSKTRHAAFTAALKVRGFSCHTFERIAESGLASWLWPNLDDALIEWMNSLPKPVAIFAANDSMGSAVLGACEKGGIAVPEQVAVLGVDNDEMMVHITSTPLSSIALPYERVAAEALEMIVRLIRNEPGADAERLVPAVRIIRRRSTDALAYRDEDVAAALRYIQEHAEQQLGVTDVARHVMVSRRTLETRFQQIAGRSILQEIHRVRVELARELLADQKLKIRAVAQRCGYPHVETFIRIFQQHTGMTPGAYRDAINAGNASA